MKDGLLGIWNDGIRNDGVWLRRRANDAVVLLNPYRRSCGVSAIDQKIMAGNSVREYKKEKVMIN